MQTRSRKRILMAEDNPYDVELTLAVLKSTDLSLDLDIDVVSDGEEALDYLYRRNRFEGRADVDPSVVLLDIKMPKISGAQVLEQIKSDEQLRSLPTVMLTSSREIKDVRVCYRLGANGYVVKPVDAKQFAKTIRDLAAYWLSTNEDPPK